MLPNTPPTPGASDDAARHFEEGRRLKAAGGADAALTAFRRAALIDPNHGDALIDIGILCKAKADADPMFFRYAYDALEKGVRLKPDREDAHNAFVLVAHKMGRLAELHSAYDAWAKAEPGNETLQRVLKNIFAISMAAIPQTVNIDAGGAPPFIRKSVLFLSLGFVVLGMVLIFGAPTVGAKRFTSEQIRAIMRAGGLMTAAGFAGFFVFVRMKK